MATIGRTLLVILLMPTDRYIDSIFIQFTVHVYSSIVACTTMCVISVAVMCNSFFDALPYF